MKWSKLAQRVSQGILISLISACTFRPSLSMRESRTEDRSAIKLVKLELNSSNLVDTPESRDTARKKLLAEIKAECLHPRLLTEGTSVEPQLTVAAAQEKTTSATEQARYYWIRYECEGI